MCVHWLAIFFTLHTINMIIFNYVSHINDCTIAGLRTVTGQYRTPKKKAHKGGEFDRILRV